MLSILIPTYNYNVYPLVLELHKQCLDCGIEFEILVQDDGSKLFLDENKKINSLTNCIFEILNDNIGRSKIRNLLAQKSKFEYLLFLDADTFPVNNNFISIYSKQIKSQEEIVFGGIQYHKNKPKKDKLLRWVYGNKRESLSVKYRSQKTNSRALASNLLVQKRIITLYPFDSQIINYGYEDLCFLWILETKNIKVFHIENPTYHLNLETSILFLKKTKTAIENLVYIINSGKYPNIDSKINSSYIVLKKIKLITVTTFIFNKIESLIISNLLSKHPSLFLYDIYKLGYYCSIK
jgi:hypothetical protein